MTGLNVDITADTRQFQAEVDNVPKSLQEISDQLNAVSKDGDRAGASLESSMRTAQKETAASGQVFRQYTENVRRGTAQQTEAFGISAREVNSIQKESLRTTAASLAQTVEQSAQSFDGTVSGALSAIQNISTGVAALSFVPEVAAAAGAVTLLTGLISGAWQKADGDTKAFKADVTQLTDSLITAGDGVAAQASRYAASVKSYVDGSNSLGYSFDVMRDKARSLHLPLTTLIAAYSGNVKAADEVREASERIVEGYKEVSKGADGQRVVASAAAVTQHDNAVAAIRDLKSYTDAAEEAAKGAETYGQIQTRQARLQADALKTVDQAYDDAAGAASGYIDAESGIFDVADYITAMQKKAQALKDFQADILTAELSPGAKEFLTSQGADAAASMLAGYESSSAAQKSALAQIWDDAGAASAGAYVKSLTSGLPATIPGPTVVPKIDNSAVNAAIDALSKRTITVNTRLSTQFGRDMP